MPDVDAALSPADPHARIAALVWEGLPVARFTVVGDPDRFAACRLVACVPACNEAARIGRCLSALDADLMPGDGIVLLANGCDDATVRLATARLAAMTRPWLVVDCTWRAGEGTAPLARRFALDVATGLAPDAVLLSIDGDTVVLPGLRAAYGDAFERGYDLVCGRIGFLPEEAALLRPADPVAETAIREYRETSREIAARIAPDPDNPWPHHGNIGGANFALTGAAYRAAGRLPTPPSGEDRALRRRMEASGFRIRYADGPRVETSCRLVGRALGGLSEELRRNRSEPDPVVDELLEPPQTLVLRCRSRRAILAARDATERAAVLRALGLAPVAAEEIAWLAGGQAWEAAEHDAPALRRTRLRLSDLRRLLPELRLASAAIRDGRFDNPGSPPI